MNSIFREQETTRLRSDDLLQKVIGGASQTIAAGFWGGGAGTQYKSLAGVLLATGAVKKYTKAKRTGILSAVGVSKKYPKIKRVGILAAVGAVARAKLNIKALTGALAFLGTAKKYGKVKRSGVLSATGLAKKTSRVNRAGVLAMAGIAKKYTRTIQVGILTFAGMAIKRTRIVCTGLFSFVGTAAKKTYKKLVGILSSAGFVISIIARRIFQYDYVSVGAEGSSPSMNVVAFKPRMETTATGPGIEIVLLNREVLTIAFNPSVIVSLSRRM